MTFIVESRKGFLQLDFFIIAADDVVLDGLKKTVTSQRQEGTETQEGDHFAASCLAHLETAVGRRTDAEPKSTRESSQHNRRDRLKESNWRNCRRVILLSREEQRLSQEDARAQNPLPKTRRHREKTIDTPERDEQTSFLCIHHWFQPRFVKELLIRLSHALVYVSCESFIILTLIYRRNGNDNGSKVGKEGMRKKQCSLWMTFGTLSLFLITVFKDPLIHSLLVFATQCPNALKRDGCFDELDSEWMMKGFLPRLQR